MLYGQNFQLPYSDGLRAHPSLKFRLLNWSDALSVEDNPHSHSSLKHTLEEADIIVGADLVSVASSNRLL